MAKRKITMITAYDYPTAKIVEETGFDYILVGDSLAMVVLGYKDTKSVTMEDMLHHTKAVIRGAPNTKVIGDMPIGTYDAAQNALGNARKFLDIGCYGVKIEGNKPEVVKTLISYNIPVMGHLGLLPQIAETFTVQGKDEATARQIYNDAKALDRMGIFALVLECIPKDLAKKITNDIKTPTIGIGAGPHCDGQVLVLHDVIGLSDMKLKMVKRYSNVKEEIQKAIKQFKEEVIAGKFPTDRHSFH